MSLVMMDGATPAHNTVHKPSNVAMFPFLQLFYKLKNGLNYKLVPLVVSTKLCLVFHRASCCVFTPVKCPKQKCLDMCAKWGGF